jgi:serine/threonine-protein kinase
MATALSPGTTVGEYRVERKIGVGGNSTVYAAVHPVLGRRVAIKIIPPCDPDTLARFREEARALGRLSHPNLIDVYAFGQLADGRAYLAMEWLDGESLDKRLRRGRLPLDEAAAIATQVADALEAAHAHGIVHRDVKPDNIVLVDGRAKLLDFGIAKLADRDPAVRPTSPDLVIGTPEYVSPEQARAQPLDARTDIYSLGVVLFEMALGELPFVARSGVEVAYLHVTAEPPRARQLWRDAPLALERLLDAMLDKDPARRPSLAEVRARLSTLGSSPRPRRRLLAWALPALLAAAALVGPRRATQPPPSAPARALPDGGQCAVEPAMSLQPEPRPPAKRRARPRPRLHAEDYLIDPFGAPR